MSGHLPRRRLARLWDLSYSSAIFALKALTRSRLYATIVKPSRTEIFVRPKTLKNPRDRPANDHNFGGHLEGTFPLIGAVNWGSWLNSDHPSRSRRQARSG